MFFTDSVVLAMNNQPDLDTIPEHTVLQTSSSINYMLNIIAIWGNSLLYINFCFCFLSLLFLGLLTLSLPPSLHLLRYRAALAPWSVSVAHCSFGVDVLDPNLKMAAKAAKNP